MYENGSVYKGDWSDDVRHGWGAATFPSGDHYEGEWYQDQIHGKGRYTMADTSYFEGDWVNGDRVQGTWVSADRNEEYCGAWKNDVYHGTGLYYKRGHYKYEGRWVDGVEQGHGRCEFADGSVYEGAWKSGQRCGFGRVSQGHARYEGEWADNQSHGQGVYIEENGDKYKGGFVGGERCGFGRCLYADGAKYEGEWKGGKRHGTGTCVYENGDVYKGQWENDQRSGQGVCRWGDDGSVFSGRWEVDGWIQSGADPTRCQVVGDGVVSGEAGVKGSFKIVANDEQGQHRLSGGDEFQALLVLRGGDNGIDPQGGVGDGSALSTYVLDSIAASRVVTVTGVVVDNDNGTYDVHYTVTTAGVYDVCITVLNASTGCFEHVAHSPYPLRISPSRPLPKHTRFDGHGKHMAISSCLSTFQIDLHDAHHNRCYLAPSAAIPPALRAYLQGGDGVEIDITFEAKDVLNGVMVASYTAPSRSGLYRLHIEWDAKALPGTPFSVRVVDSEKEFEQQVMFGLGKKMGGKSQQWGGEEEEEGGEGDESVLASETTTTSSKQATKSAGFIQDTVSEWERIAADAYGADGVMEGWDSDEEERKKKETPEEKYAREHPNVPIVDNLEDVWLVAKLQQERKMKEEEEKRKKLEAVQEGLKQKGYESIQGPNIEEAREAMKKIVRNDMEEEKKKEKAAVVRRETGTKKKHSKLTKEQLLASASALDTLLA